MQTDDIPLESHRIAVVLVAHAVYAVAKFVDLAIKLVELSVQTYRSGLKFGLKLCKVFFGYHLANDDDGRGDDGDDGSDKFFVYRQRVPAFFLGAGFSVVAARYFSAASANTELRDRLSSLAF
jgi:hypothetical protein